MNSHKKNIFVFVSTFFIMLALYGCGQSVDLKSTSPVSENSGQEKNVSENSIKDVIAIAFMDVDGAKLKGVAVEYDTDLAGAQITPDMFELVANKLVSLEYCGDGEVGTITKAYINDEPAISESGGKDYGNYVILEVFTDWRSDTELKFTNSLNAKVTQVKDITYENGVIPATDVAYGTVSGGKKVVNFVMPDIEGFKYYTDDPGDYGADGQAYYREKCFSTITGEYTDEHLAYALFLPKDYKEDGTYALVTVDNPATSKGSHTLLSVLETRTPAVLASEKIQELVKSEQGVDGLIVVVPVITERVNDNGGTPAEYEALVHLWDELIENYNVSPEHVYGVGQSVGGMVLLETNRNRDNFFAGVLLYEDQWAQNYYIDTTFARDMAANEATEAKAPLHYPRVDEYITWDYYLSSDGEKIYDDYDPLNYYYLVSDDNILVIHGAENYSSSDAWNEMKYLYYDLAGYDMKTLALDGTNTTSDQNATLKSFLNREDELNINNVSIENGTTGYSCRKLDYEYEWLLSQKQFDEITREKLDINKPFEMAQEQIQTKERTLDFTDKDGNEIYYLTGKRGAGTKFYNSSLLNMATIADGFPGWLPDGMDFENGVSEAKPIGMTVINDNTLAIEYDTDMSGIEVLLKGDNVLSYFGNVRTDDFVLYDPFQFFDSSGNAIDVTISNLYVNTNPEAVNGAEKLSGEGPFLILEISSDSARESASFKQTRTLRTQKVIANASYKYYTNN